MEQQRVTPAQVVAYNMRRWRTAAGFTQAQLGERIGGWSLAAVSAAERSFDGDHHRSFGADTLVALAAALGVPLIALFLPPEDHDRYTLEGTGPAGPEDMAGLMALVMPDSDDQTPVMDAYRQALTTTVSQLMDPGWGEEVARWLGEMGGPEIRTERLARLNALIAELRALADAIQGGP